jgi:hypothetical protein
VSEPNPDLTRHCVHCETRLVDGRDGSERCLCPACGYCTHPSQSGRAGFWVCNACGAQLEPLRIEPTDAAVIVTEDDGEPN